MFQCFRGEVAKFNAFTGRTSAFFVYRDPLFAIFGGTFCQGGVFLAAYFAQERQHFSVI